MTTHGALTESSVSDHVVTHDRKGREGKGERKGEWLSFSSMTSGSCGIPGEKRMAADAAEIRGVR